ncbi:MAG: CopG family transcriptional regulator [Tissierellaceae bacterium]|nr:CopG family transcriptional regulator [Tissierellaceae bacterium]
MAGTKKAVTRLSKGLINQMNLMVPMEYRGNADCMGETVRAYMKNKNRMEFVKMLKEGYEEMSQINLDLAEIGLEQDICDLVVYEVRLKRRGML